MYDPSREANAGLAMLTKKLLEVEERKRYHGYLMRNSGYLGMQRFSAQCHMLNQHKWQQFMLLLKSCHVPAFGRAVSADPSAPQA